MWVVSWVSPTAGHTHETALTEVDAETRAAYLRDIKKINQVCAYWIPDEGTAA